MFVIGVGRRLITADRPDEGAPEKRGDDGSRDRDYATLRREMRFDLEREVLLRTASIRKRLEEAEFHLARLNSYSWTRFGLRFDRGLQKIFSAFPVKKKCEATIASFFAVCCRQS